MRVLHTADWHLCDILGSINRTEDLRKAVLRVAALCEEHKVDVLVVAGDLFSEQARIDSLREAIEHWQTAFGPFFARGGTMIAITGNHDNVNFCESIGHAMALAAPTIGMKGQRVPGGRLYLATEPSFLRLKDPNGSGDVQLVLMPYPTPAQYFRGETKIVTSSDKHKRLAEGFVNKLEEIAKQPGYDPKLPTVLVAHVNVAGVPVGTHLFRITAEHDVVIPTAALVGRYSYVALGHIHKPQAVMVPTIRYAGSIETLDAGERDDQKSVALFDIGPTGVQGDVQVLNIPSTRLYDLKITNPKEDIPRIQEELQDPANALVKVEVVYTAGVDHLESVLNQLHDVFPRMYAGEWKESTALSDPMTVTDPDRDKSFQDTVLDYLNHELSAHEPGFRDSVVALARELMDQLEAEVTA